MEAPSPEQRRAPGSESRSSAAPTPRRRRVVILGATGSIGSNAIDVCTHLSDEFEIEALTACTSWKKLAEQARAVRPGYVGLNDASTEGKPTANLKALRAALEGTDVEVVCGEQAMADLVTRPDVDIVVAAVVGAAGLK